MDCASGVQDCTAPKIIISIPANRPTRTSFGFCLTVSATFFATVAVSSAALSAAFAVFCVALVDLPAFAAAYSFFIARFCCHLEYGLLVNCGFSVCCSFAEIGGKHHETY